MTLTIAEMRAAIHMTHACEATKLVSAERATYRHDDGEEVVDVHLFEISGHPHASQCFVWADVVDRIGRSFQWFCGPAKSRPLIVLY